MKINLRKASALQSAIRAAVSERVQKVTGTLSMPLWKVSDEQIAVERTKQVNLLSDIERLESIIVHIRENTGMENVKNGVNNLLAEQAELTKQIARYKNLLKSDVAPSSNDLDQKVTALKESNTRSVYNTRDQIDVGVFSSKDIEKFNSTFVQLRRRQTEIGDKLIAANVTSEITIADSDWSWLELQGIV
jgi:hypothetical protein